MAGIDDNVAIMGDSVAPSPSPRIHFTAISDNDKSSKRILEREPSFTDNKIEGLFQGSQEHTSSVNAEKMDSLQVGFPLIDEKPSSRGGLGERIAARGGFNAPRLNTENIRSADFSFNPDVHSPCLTIYSPGLSPAALLESPVFLSNPLVQQSPTTGKFPFNSSGNGNTMSSVPSDRSKGGFFEDINASFAFLPVSKPSSSFSPGAITRVAVLPHQSFPNNETSIESENSLNSQTVGSVKNIPRNKESLSLEAEFPGSSPEKNNGSNSVSASERIFDSANESGELSPPLDDPQEEEHRRCGDFMAGGALAEDGYNWRKYGQKQVKGSEYPRSYYKCTNPDCPVKKKVERSLEGHITEIIYSGAHNHPKPQPNRQSAIGSSNPSADLQSDVREQMESRKVMGRDSVWANTQQGGVAGTPDNFEVTSAGSVGFKYDNPSGSLQVQRGSQFQLGEVADASSGFSNGEDDDDGGTHGTASMGHDGEGEESEPKRRKLEVYATEMTGATRAIREPRVVVQTTSDVDIIDDGYRWRKYGQKVVKGNPNPRSYYKCTAQGCTVRKHVERASHDLKSVITTYEGMHNHDVPAARNNNHNGSGGSAKTQQAATASISQTHVHQAEPRRRFERPVFSSSSSFGPFSFHRQQLAVPFGMNQMDLANLGMPGLGFGSGKLPILPVHPYLAQLLPGSGLGSVLPKGDPKVEPISETGLGLSNSSSIYRQMLNRLPLEPQM